jgi:branched-chain amino acid transport system permease protein
MQTILENILLGLSSGAVIALLALALVISHRGSGIVNLSTGAVAMIGGYAFWALRTGAVASVTLATVPAIIVALLVTMLVGAAIELIAYRPLRTSTPLAKLICSLGIMLILQATMLLAFGSSGQPEPSILPSGPVTIFGDTFPSYNLIMIAIAIVVTLGLWALYRFTNFGLATRAASENEVAAMLGGLSPARLAMINTLLASLVAGSVGIISGVITELDTNTLPLQVVPALAAALIASFSSFGLACFAGIGVGVLYSLIDYLTNLSWFPHPGGTSLSGVPELATFAIIATVMFFRAGSLPTRGELVERRLPSAPRPQNIERWAVIAAIACGTLMVVFPFDFRQALINTMVGVLMALSLVVITGFVGQISVVQLTLAGVAGFVISHLGISAGLGFPLAPLLGVVVAVVFGLITAASALRVRGVNLAVVTLAAVVAITSFGFNNNTWGVSNTGASTVGAPHLLGLAIGPSAGINGLDGNPPSSIFGWWVLGLTIVLCLCVGWLRRSELGQRMLAVRSNERAAAAAGVDPRRIKLLGFGISAAIAALAGSVMAYNVGAVSVDAYDPLLALSLLAFAYVGGIGLISGAVFAGLISTQALFPYALDKWLGVGGNWFLLFGGVMLVLTLIRDPEGVAGTIYRKLHRREPVVEPPASAAAAEAVVPVADAVDAIDAAAVAGAPSKRPAHGEPVLRVRGLSVSFGGVRAVSQVDLDVHEGELVGLIGPNGAGKTTLIDAISGFVPSAGSVELDGHDLTRLPPHARARLGLVRTWQGVDLFDDLEVAENLAVVGRSGEHATGAPHAGGLRDPLRFVGLEWAASAMPDQLPQGQRKLVGVARALAAQPRLLCLDEPAAGLDSRESQELGAKLRELADHGQSMLLIDHDMGIVLAICDRVIVLEFGEVIADGPPNVVRDDPRVISAYLGAAAKQAV